MPTEERYTAKEMVEAIKAEDGVVSDVADRLGCSRMTVYNYRKRYKTVADALDEQRTDLVYEMRDRLKDQARNEDVNDAVQQKAILKLLEVFDKEIEWSDKQRQEVTGKGGSPVQVVFDSDVPDPDDE